TLPKSIHLIACLGLSQICPKESTNAFDNRVVNLFVDRLDVAPFHREELIDEIGGALRVREFLNGLGLPPVASSLKTSDGRIGKRTQSSPRVAGRERKTNVKEVGEQKKRPTTLTRRTTRRQARRR